MHLGLFLSQAKQSKWVSVCMIFFHTIHIFSMSFNLPLLNGALILNLKMGSDMVFKVKSCHKLYDVFSQLLSKPFCFHPNISCLLLH